MAADGMPGAGSESGLTVITRNGPTRRWVMPRRRKSIAHPNLTEPSHRVGRPCVPSRRTENQRLSNRRRPDDRARPKTLEIRAPAALEEGAYKNGEGGRAVSKTVRSLFSKVLWKRGKRQQTITNISDSRPAKSILNYAFSGLKDGVHLKWLYLRRNKLPDWESEQGENETFPETIMRQAKFFKNCFFSTR